MSSLSYLGVFPAYIYQNWNVLGTRDAKAKADLCDRILNHPCTLVEFVNCQMIFRLQVQPTISLLKSFKLLQGLVLNMQHSHLSYNGRKVFCYAFMALLQGTINTQC